MNSLPGVERLPALALTLVVLAGVAPVLAEDLFTHVSNVVRTPADQTAGRCTSEAGPRVLFQDPRDRGTIRHRLVSIDLDRIGLEAVAPHGGVDTPSADRPALTLTDRCKSRVSGIDQILN